MRLLSDLFVLVTGVGHVIAAWLAVSRRNALLKRVVSHLTYRCTESLHASPVLSLRWHVHHVWTNCRLLILLLSLCLPNCWQNCLAGSIILAVMLRGCYCKLGSAFNRPDDPLELDEQCCGSCTLSRCSILTAMLLLHLPNRDHGLQYDRNACLCLSSELSCA